MKYSALALIAATTIAAANLFAAPSLAQDNGHGRKHQAHAAGYSAKSQAAGASDPEFSPLQQLASDIDQLGTSTYPSTYIGVALDSSGQLTVYVVPGDDSALLNAIAALNTANLPYTVANGSLNYASLAGVSQWIASNQAMLLGEGIAPAWWGGDPPSDAIQVQMQIPTSAQLTQLQATAANILSSSSPVTQANYGSVAVSVMNAQAPSPGSIVLYPGLTSPFQPSDWRNDNKPFDGADLIEYTLNNIENCTSDFSFNKKSNPSNHLVVTAAHCSSEQTGHDWYTCYTTSGGECNYNVGTVSQVYWDKQDFELTSSSNEGYVWNTSTDAKWSVHGWLTAELLDKLTTDGQHGAHYGNAVVSGGTATCVNNSGHTVCDAFILNGGNTDICPGGDSGGPVLQRESDGYHIAAAGLILGRSQLSDGTWICAAQQVYKIRQADGGLDVIWGN